MMKRLGLIALVLLALLAAASISFSSGRTLEIVDSAGAPLDPGYVAYWHMGYRLNPAHPVTYRATRFALARSNRSGRVTVPRALHIHRPFPIETHPSLWVEIVYVPRLHNASGQMNKESPSLPGIFEMDAARTRATVSDLADRPELWEGSLRNLSSIIGRLVWSPPEESPLQDSDPATLALARELISHFREEYEAFLARYADVERPRPEMPAHLRGSSPDGQRRWTEHIEADLAREPTWGIVARRLFSDEVATLERVGGGVAVR